MAYYANTTWLDALSFLQDQANKDLRAPAYGVTRAFNDRKRNVIQNYEDEKSLKVIGKEVKNMMKNYPIYP